MSTYTLARDIGPDDSPIALTSAYFLTGSYPGRVVCDSEVMYVTGGDGTAHVSVLRGCDGTDRASHGIGAAFADANIPTAGGGGSVTVTGDLGGSVSNVQTLHVSGSVSELAPGTAAQGYVVQRIGPYAMDKDTPNVNSDVIVLSPALSDGSIVLEAWALFPIEWKSNTNATCDFKIELASFPTPYFTTTLKEYPASTGTFTTNEPIPIGSGTHTHTIPAGTDGAGGVTGASSAVIPSTLGIVDYAAWSAAAGDPVTAIQLSVEVYANSGASITQGEAQVYALIASPAT